MEGPVVSVKQGKLRGVVKESAIGGTYIAFRGIPFAAPPLGNLRFKDPEPPQNWSGIRDASKEVGDIAMQINEYPPYDILGGEDCLYLSVYTESVTEKKPVIVWIHGGGYSTGTERRAQPDYVIGKGVVLVSISYRVGALGFLNLGHEVANGNQGLKDQVAALKWVKENISNFGGDPNNVTACGASAGGASVHLLSISPMSKGLINKGILISGTATCPWAVTGSCSDRSFKIAEMLGYDSTDPVKVIEFLRTVPAEKIVRLQAPVVTQSEKTILQVSFGPSVDDKSRNPFLPRPVKDYLTNDIEIPFLLGHTSHEYIMFMRESTEEAFQKYERLFAMFVKNLAFSQDHDKVARLTTALRDYYFYGKAISKDLPAELIQFMTDVYFANDTKQVAIDRSKRNTATTYLYRFSYIGNEPSSTKNLVKNPVVTGASHVDDVPYIFYDALLKAKNPAVPSVGTKDRIMVERMSRIVTNFAKSGDPTSTLDEFVDTVWKPVTKDDLNCLNIDSDLKNVAIDTKPMNIFQQYA